MKETGIVNRITITGKTALVENFFHNFVKNSKIDFNLFKEIPSKEDTPQKIQNWCEKNWGVRKNAANSFVEISLHECESVISLYFETEKSAPRPIINMITEMYQTLIFEYYAIDFGWLIARKSIYKDGKLFASVKADVEELSKEKFQDYFEIYPS